MYSMVHQGGIGRHTRVEEKRPLRIDQAPLLKERLEASAHRPGSSLKEEERYLCADRCASLLPGWYLCADRCASLSPCGTSAQTGVLPPCGNV